MKKLLVTTLITGAFAASVLAQGTVFLPLQTTRYIQYTTNGSTLVQFPTGSPSTVGTYGSLNVATYFATAGTASPFTATAGSLIPSAWTQSTELLNNLYGPGVNLGKTFTFATGTGGANDQVFVVGWTGAFANWNSAWTAGTGLLGWTGSTLSGGALSWLNGTGNPAGSPPTSAIGLTVGAGGYNGLVLTPVPEPTSFALLGLGAAALLAFRRRN